MAWFGKGAAAAAALMICAAASAATPPQPADKEAQRNPIQVPGSVWAFDGFTVTMPADTGWYSEAKTPHYADLSKDFGGDLKAALVVDAHPLPDSIVKEAELLQTLKEEQSAVPDKAMKLIDYSAKTFSPKGALCARFDVQFDDRRATFAQPGILMVRGVACIPPSQPKAIVSVRYAQRTAEAKWSDAVKSAAEPVIESLRFIPINLDAIKQARDAVRAEKPDQAVALLSQPAEQGDTEAAVFLGNLFLYGRAVKPDYEQARRWLEKASRDGHVDALYNLGAMYDKGIGVERDTKQALRWFTLAADQRDPQAQLNLGIIYANGNGVDRDVAQGEQWLKRAAANGNKRAEGLLRTGQIGKPQQQ
jgi:hypothetical protein